MSPHVLVADHAGITGSHAVSMHARCRCGLLVITVADDPAAALDRARRAIRHHRGFALAAGPGAP